MIYLNRIEIMGYTGQDAETFISQQSGKKCVKFSVATTRRAKGANQESTQWHNVVAWGATAEILDKKRVAKGTPVFVTGELHHRKWTSKGGETHTDAQIVASLVQTMKFSPEPAENYEDVPF